MWSLNLSALRKVSKNISADRLNFNNHVHATAFYDDEAGLNDLNSYTKNEIDELPKS